MYQVPRIHSRICPFTRGILWNNLIVVLVLSIQIYQIPVRIIPYVRITYIEEVYHRFSTMTDLPVPDQLKVQLGKCKSIRDLDYHKSRTKTAQVRSCMRTLAISSLSIPSHHWVVAVYFVRTHHSGYSRNMWPLDIGLSTSISFPIGWIYGTGANDLAASPILIWIRKDSFVMSWLTEPPI